MGDGELDRVDPREIGGIERVLASRPALRFLAEHRRERVDDRIEDGHGVDSAATGLLFELAPDGAVHQGVEDKAGATLDVVEDPVEMAFRADHRPGMAKDLDPVELGEAGLGDHLQASLRSNPRADGGEADRPSATLGRLWISMWEFASLSLGSVASEGFAPVTLGFDPQSRKG